MFLLFSFLVCVSVYCLLYCVWTWTKGMVFIIDIYLLLAAHKRILALCWPFNQFILCLFHCVHCENVFIWLMNFNKK